MEATLRYTDLDVQEATAWAERQLLGWGVRSGHVGPWLRRGADLLGPGRTATAVLCYDAAEQLLSVDVWCDGQRLFGMDDLV